MSDRSHLPIFVAAEASDIVAYPLKSLALVQDANILYKARSTGESKNAQAITAILVSSDLKQYHGVGLPDFMVTTTKSSAPARY